MKTMFTKKTGLLKSGIGNVFLKHVISYETEMLRFKAKKMQFRTDVI